MFPHNRGIFSSLNFAHGEVHCIPPVGDPEEAVPIATATCNAQFCYQSLEADVSMQSESGPSGILLNMHSLHIIIAK